MALRMRVVGSHAAQLGDKSSRAFGVHGGRIGRALDNEWVLPDPARFVSGHHAAVEYRSGQWLLVDTSSNGTFLNASTVPLRDTGARALRDGDQLRMGDYQIVVSISPDNDFPPDSSGVAAYDVVSDDFAIATHGDIGADLNLVSLLGNPEPPADDDSVPIRDAYGQSFDEPDEPPPPPEYPAKGVVRPKAWRTAPSGRTEPQGAELGPAVQLLARGAGLDPSTIGSERHAMLLGFAGQLLREMTLGLSAALKARAESRGEDLRSSDHPLETPASVEETLLRLLSPPRAHAPLAVDLVREGFASLRHHELATQAALRLAIDEYVRRFAPATLQAQFDQSLQRSPGTPGKSRYWELYADMYRVLSQSNAAGLPHAFADAFARAYANQGNPTTMPPTVVRSDRGST